MNRPLQRRNGQVGKTNLVSRRVGRKTDYSPYLPREKLPYFSPTSFRVRRGRRPRRPTLRQNTRQICMLILRGTWTGDGHETGGDEKPISSPAGWGADTAYGGETSPPTKPRRGQIKQSHTQRERRKTDFPLYLPREKLPYFSPTPFRVRRGRRPRRPTIQAPPLIPCLFVRTILVSLFPHINAKKAEQARNLLSLSLQPFISFS